MVPKEGNQRKACGTGTGKMPVWFLSKDRERIKREEGRTIGAVKEVEEWLGLKGI